MGRKMDALHSRQIPAIDEKPSVLIVHGVVWFVLKSASSGRGAIWDPLTFQRPPPPPVCQVPGPWSGALRVLGGENTGAAAGDGYRAFLHGPGVMDEIKRGDLKTPQGASFADIL